MPLRWKMPECLDDPNDDISAEPAAAHLRYYFPQFYGVLATEALKRLRATLPEYRQDYYKTAFDIMDLELNFARQARVIPESLKDFIENTSNQSNRLNQATEPEGSQKPLKGGVAISANLRKYAPLPKDEIVNKYNKPIKSTVSMPTAESVTPSRKISESSSEIRFMSDLGSANIQPNSAMSSNPQIEDFASHSIFDEDTNRLVKITVTIPDNKSHDDARISLESEAGQDVFDNTRYSDVLSIPADRPDTLSQDQEALRNFVDSPSHSESLDSTFGPARATLPPHRPRRNLAPHAETPRRPARTKAPTRGRTRRAYRLSYIGLRPDPPTQPDPVCQSHRAPFPHHILPDSGRRSRITPWNRMCADATSQRRRRQQPVRRPRERICRRLIQVRRRRCHRWPPPPKCRRLTRTSPATTWWTGRPRRATPARARRRCSSSSRRRRGRRVWRKGACAPASAPPPPSAPSSPAATSTSRTAAAAPATSPRPPLALTGTGTRPRPRRSRPPPPATPRLHAGSAPPAPHGPAPGRRIRPWPRIEASGRRRPRRRRLRRQWQR